MLKIAVCDDNESFLETLKKIISESARDYFKDIMFNVSIMVNVY